MNGISYWQQSLRLAGDVGVCAVAPGLPQDEATAAVVIAAILARNFGPRPPALSCGMYRAELDTGNGSCVVRGVDARVVLARRLLARAVPGDRMVWRGFTTAELAQVREAVLIALQAGQLELAIPACDRNTDQAADRTAPGTPPAAGLGVPW